MNTRVRCAHWRPFIWMGTLVSRAAVMIRRWYCVRLPGLQLMWSGIFRDATAGKCYSRTRSGPLSSSSRAATLTGLATEEQPLRARRTGLTSRTTKFLAVYKRSVPHEAPMQGLPLCHSGSRWGQWSQGVNGRRDDSQLPMPGHDTAAMQIRRRNSSCRLRVIRDGSTLLINAYGQMSNAPC